MAMFHDRVLAENKLYQLETSFGKLKTNQERVIFALNIMTEYHLVCPFRATGLSKDARKSENLRKQGNRVFLIKDPDNVRCISALESYTKSIAFAPYPSVQLALAYANRSAVLCQLGLHSECIQDIDRALALNYPDNLKAKLYVCRAECLMILKSCSMEGTLQKAQHWLDKMSLSDASQKKLRLKLEALQSKVVQTKQFIKDKSVCTEAKKSESESPLPTIASYNDEIPCASSAVAVKYSKHYGRHVVATRDIRPGEVIAVEKPYILLLMQDKMQTHCSNCLEVCWANIPCKYCTYTMYCSEECRDAEWERYHDVECTVFPTLFDFEFFDFNFICLRLAVLSIKEAGGIKELRNILKNLDECKDPRTRNFSQDDKLHSDSFVSVYNLVTNTEKKPVHDLLRISLDASIILFFLATHTAMFGAKLPKDLSVLAKNDDVTFFGGLILRYQQIVANNSHIVNDVQDSERMLDRGEAVMPFCSLFNHSCYGNVVRQSRSKHIVIYALHPIRKGEQLFDNYGPHYDTHDTREIRQKELFKQFYFFCNCVPCREDWPMFHDLPSFKTLVKRAKDKVKIKKALWKLNMYDKLMMEDNVRDKPYIIENLLKMIRILHNYAPIPCEELIHVSDTLERVYHLNGNRFKVPQIWTEQE